MSEANEPQAQLGAVCLTAGLEVIATRCEWPNWNQYHDKADPMPKEWDDEPPQEVMQLVARTDVEVLMLNKERELADLRRLLDEAADDIADWGSYASEYFRDKHDLAGCVAKYRRMTSNVEVRGR